MTRKFLLASMLFCIGTSAAMAQSNDTEDTETIEVVGKVPPTLLYKRMTTARLDFYDLFNDLTEVDEYKMICERKAAIGSRMKKLSCEPEYYKEKARELAITFNGGNPNGLPARVTPQAIALATVDKKKEADAYMIKLIQENDQLWDRYQKLIKASKAYEASVEG